MPTRRYSREELLAAAVGFSHPQTVRFQDVDAAGIAFFPRIFEYCHDAFVRWLAEAGEPLPAALFTQSWAGPLAHAEADFLRPLHFGDELRVAIVAAELIGSTLTLGYRLALSELPSPRGPRVRVSGEVVAVAQTVHIFVTPKTFQRMPPPPRIIEAVARLTAR